MWLDELPVFLSWILLVKLFEPPLIGRQSEEIILLRDQFPRPPANLAVRRFRRIAYVKVVVDAVTSFILLLVDRPLRRLQRLVPFQSAPHQILYGSRVSRLRSANEFRIRDSK